MSESTLNLHIKDRCAWLEIDHAGRRNAMTQQMWAQMPVLLEQAMNRKQVRVLLLRGARHTFCAGADIHELIRQAQDPQFIEQNQACIRQAMLVLEQFPLPTIALLEGACFGGGVALALACDFRIATTDSRFAVTPARLGIPYSLADTRKLHHIVGAALCRELLLAAKELDATQALAAGLVQQLVAPEQLEDEAADLAHRLSTLSPFAQQAIKRTLHVIEGSSDESAESLYQRMLSSFQGADFQEGVRAFADKRQAVFKR